MKPFKFLDFNRDGHVDPIEAGLGLGGFLEVNDALEEEEDEKALRKSANPLEDECPQGEDEDIFEDAFDEDF